VFVFGAAADAVSIGRDQFVRDLRSQFEQVKDAELRVQSSQIQVGLCDSGRSAWFFDRFVLETVFQFILTHASACVAKMQCRP
jgi:hypothetical protein